jgi:vacuolar-type H+-ATPase subunit E/Vma4
VVVYVRSKDIDLAKEIINKKGLKNLVEVRDVKEVGRTLRGGALGKSKKGNVWYNYSLERFFEEVKESAYGKVLELLEA